MMRIYNSHSSFTVYVLLSTVPSVVCWKPNQNHNNNQYSFRNTEIKSGRDNIANTTKLALVKDQI